MTRRSKKRFKPRLDEEDDIEEDDEFDIDMFDVWLAEAELWKAKLYHEARKLARKRRIETYII